MFCAEEIKVEEVEEIEDPKSAFINRRIITLIWIDFTVSIQKNAFIRWSPRKFRSRSMRLKSLSKSGESLGFQTVSFSNLSSPSTTSNPSTTFSRAQGNPLVSFSSQTTSISF